MTQPTCNLESAPGYQPWLPAAAQTAALWCPPEHGACSLNSKHNCCTLWKEQSSPSIKTTCKKKRKTDVNPVNLSYLFLPDIPLALWFLGAARVKERETLICSHVSDKQLHQSRSRRCTSEAGPVLTEVLYVQRLGQGSGSRSGERVLGPLLDWSPGRPPPTGKTAV